MGDLTKFTGITIQPAEGGLANRVTTFHLQYSREGLKWEYAVDESANLKVSCLCHLIY